MFTMIDYDSALDAATTFDLAEHHGGRRRRRAAYRNEPCPDARRAVVASPASINEFAQSSSRLRASDAAVWLPKGQVHLVDGEPEGVVNSAFVACVPVPFSQSAAHGAVPSVADAAR